MSQNPNALQLLSLLCLLPDGVALSVLPSMLPSMKNSRKSGLTLLAIALAFKEKDRIRVLSPIRDFILTQYPPATSLLKELRLYFGNLTMEVHKIGAEGGRAAAELLLTEYRNINSVLLHAWSSPIDSGDHEALLAATRRHEQFSYTFRHGSCIAVLSEAAKVLTSAGDLKGTAECAYSMGALLCHLHRSHEALAELEAAKSAFQDLGDVYQAAECTSSIAHVLVGLGRYEESTTMLGDAIRAFRSIGRLQDAATSTYHLGTLLHVQKREDDAASKIEEAKSMFETLGDSLGVVKCIQSLARLNSHGERARRLALTQLEAARTNSEAHPRWGAEYSQQIGYALIALGCYDEGIVELLKAKALFEASGMPIRVANCAIRVAEVLCDVGRYPEAIAQLDELKTTIAMEDQPGVEMARCQEALGRIYMERESFEEAAASFGEAVKIWQRNENIRKVAECKELLFASRLALVWSRENEGVGLIPPWKRKKDAFGDPSDKLEYLYLAVWIRCEIERAST